MDTDWNLRKLQFTGNTIGWEQKDDIQRLLSIMQSDVVDTINTVLEYWFVNDFFDEHIDFINKAPYFWSEVIHSLRFTMIMETARVFDESKDAIGLLKVFNILEQSLYRDVLIHEIEKAREQYSSYREYIEEIRILRDKIYAHNDRKEYRFWQYPHSKDIGVEGKLYEMLVWARDTLHYLRILTGDEYSLNREINNDVPNLIE